MPNTLPIKMQHHRIVKHVKYSVSNKLLVFVSGKLW